MNNESQQINFASGFFIMEGFCSSNANFSTSYCHTSL